MTGKAKSPLSRPMRVRFSHYQWATIQVAAGQADTPPSSFVREAALSEARRRINRGLVESPPSESNAPTGAENC